MNIADIHFFAYIIFFFHIFGLIQTLLLFNECYIYAKKKKTNILPNNVELKSKN